MDQANASGADDQGEGTNPSTLCRDCAAPAGAAGAPY